MMGYKAQVVASAIALPIRRKIETSGRSTIDFHRLSWPQTATYREGNENFKMMVVASKKSTGVVQNRPWKIGGQTGLNVWKNPRESWAFFFFFFFS
ncbi:hypothetical protein DVH24_026826 [Malus domestica]|uniref:Uncharacterized protein n=1 Tax=Malus domestica TaxID=3750 RepID=A0A498K4J7_MALDO|nr:hypothetical protein DVH24_026826 [Malus domestica]